MGRLLKEEQVRIPCPCSSTIRTAFREGKRRVYNDAVVICAYELCSVAFRMLLVKGAINVNGKYGNLQQNLSGFILLLVLGLRFGLDPDHITVIDGYTYRLHQKHHAWTRWQALSLHWVMEHGYRYRSCSKLLRNTIEIPYAVNANRLVAGIYAGYDGCCQCNCTDTADGN